MIMFLLSSLSPPSPLDKMIHEKAANGQPSDIYSTVMLVTSFVIVTTTLMLVPNAIYFRRYCPTEEVISRLILSKPSSASASSSSTASIHLLPAEKGVSPSKSQPLKMELMPKSESAKGPKIQNLKNRSSILKLPFPREKNSINTKIKQQQQKLGQGGSSIKVITKSGKMITTVN